MTVAIIQWVSGEYYLKVDVNKERYVLPKTPRLAFFPTADSAETFLKDFILTHNYRELPVHDIWDTNQNWIYKVYQSAKY